MQGKDSTLEVEDEVLKAVLVDEESNKVRDFIAHQTVSDLERLQLLYHNCTHTC